MITLIRGILRSVGEEDLTLAVEPFEVEVFIPESARRQLQAKVGEMVGLHTLFYIEGNTMGGRMTPRLVGFLSPIDRERDWRGLGVPSERTTEDFASGVRVQRENHPAGRAEHQSSLR